MISYAIVSIGDKASQGKREDKSGAIIKEMFNERAHLIHYETIPDEKDIIQTVLRKLSDTMKARLVLTTGGTGFSQRDNTPEATKKVIEKEAPGFGEIMRTEGFKRTPMAILSRGIAGIRGKTLIINLPGSSRGVRESLEIIMPVLEHGLGILKENKDHDAI
ncbi:MAG: MogA/MoaB family molybdenum cofactor biosynthesis protein [Deltaproteobacteria bacterium]|nr:MogA/MoaB family molybdenum cofactor biosynthesis protein [Deltaproteobacteria bacterium]